MFPLHKLVLLLSAVVAVAGCSKASGSHTSVFQYLSVQGDAIAVHAYGKPDALIRADGSLSIAGTAVALTPTQQELLKHYYASAIALRADGIATGVAGAATGGQAIASVASGLLSGNPDKIGSEVSAQADKVEAAAAKLCTDLDEIRATQGMLAQQLPTFKPYALMDAQTEAGCRRK